MWLFASAGQQAAHSSGWGHMDGWGVGWMWLWGSLMMLSWVAIVAAAIWFMIRRRGGSGTSRARDILDERYARGELSSEEYRERLEQMR